MAPNVHEISFLSETYRIKQVVENVLGFIKSSFPTLSNEDAGDLKLIFSELLFNAAIHGNHRDCTKRIHIHIEINNSTIFATVTDEGSGFDYLSLMSRFDEDANLSGESGRGIRLVYSLTDSLAFNVSGNEIQFYKKVNSFG